MANIILYQNSMSHTLWNVLEELNRNGPFNINQVRQGIRTLAQDASNPLTRRWARVLLELPRLRDELQRLERMGVTRHAPSQPTSPPSSYRYWEIDSTNRVVINPVILATDEEFEILDAVETIARSRSDPFLKQDELENIVRLARRTRGQDPSAIEMEAIIHQLRTTHLLRCVQLRHEGRHGNFYQLHEVGRLLYRQLRLPNAAIAPAPADVVTLDSSDDSESRSSSPLPPRSLAIETAQALTQMHVSASDIRGLWSMLDEVVADAATRHRVDPVRLRNEILQHLLVWAGMAALEPDQPGTSAAEPVVSPFLGADFSAAIGEHLQDALRTAAYEVARMYHRLPALTSEAQRQEMRWRLERMVRRVAAHYGLSADALLLQPMVPLAPTPPAHDPLQAMRDDVLDTDPLPAPPPAPRAGSSQHVLLLEIEPALPIPLIDHAAQARLARYPPGTERYRLRRDGSWQHWRAGHWQRETRRLHVPLGLAFKVVVVGEGQSQSAHEDSNRVGDRLGSELAASLGDLLASPCRIKRLSLLACRPGLGFVQSLLESLHDAHIAVDDVVRRRGPVLLTGDGRGWVASEGPAHWFRGQGTREIIVRDPVSGVLTVSPENQPGSAMLNMVADDAIGPLGALVPADETALDGRVFGARARAALTRLADGNGLDSSWVPLFKSLHPATEGGWSMRLLQPASGRSRDIVTREPLLPALANTLESEPGPAQTGFHLLHRSFGYSLGLMAILQRSTAAARLDDPLERALRLHAELGRVQFTHTALEDIGQLTQAAFDVLRDGRAFARNAALGQSLSQGLRLGSRGVGIGLGMVGIGFDISELRAAATPAERALFGAQLGFDATSALIDGGALVADAAGMGALAEAAGPLGVGIGLIGFVVTTVLQSEAQRHALLAAEIAVEQFFAQLDHANQEDGCDFDADSHTLRPRIGAVITRLDMVQGEVDFSSARLMASRLATVGYTDFSAVGEPTYEIEEARMLDDSARAFSLRERLALPARAALRAGTDARNLILPATPASVIRYQYQRLRRPYQTTPPIVVRQPGYQLQQRLARNGDFFPDHQGRSIVAVQTEYQDTHIVIRLGARSRCVLTPPLPEAVARHLRYTLHGAGGRYLLVLSEAVAAYRLETDADTASDWLLDASQFSDAIVPRYDAAGLSLGTLRVEIPDGDDSLSLRLGGGETWRLERSGPTSRRTLLALDAARLSPPVHNKEQLLTRLAGYAAAGEDGCQDDVVVVENPPHPGGGRAFYHRDSHRLVLAGTGDTQAELIALQPDCAFFAQRDTGTVLQTRDSGEIVARLQGIFGGDDARFAAIRPQGDAALLEQHIGPVDAPRLILRYRLQTTPPQLRLTGVRSVLDIPARLDGEADFRNWLARAAGREALSVADTARVAAGYADWVALGSLPSATPSHWRRTSDGLLVTPRARDPLSPLPADLVLLAGMPTDSRSGPFFFHSPSRRTLYRQERDGADAMPLPPIAVTAIVEGVILLTDSEGVVLRLDPDGSTHLTALTRAWFDKHRNDWWRVLPTLVASWSDSGPRYEATIALPAIHDSQRRERAVWYDVLRRGIAIAAQPLAGRSPRFVGVDIDDVAWLFDLAAGKIFAQDLLEPDWVDLLLDSEGRLASEVSLVATPVLGDETIVRADIVGGRLQAHNRDGLIFGLGAHGRPRLQAIGDETAPAGDRPRPTLPQLASRYAHPEAIRIGQSRDAPYGWYHAAGDAVIVADGAQLPLFIGFDSARQCAYYFDRADGTLRSQVQGHDSVYEGRYRDAWRGGRWLLLHGLGSGAVGELRPLPLDGVERVWLAGDGNTQYRIDAAARNALREVVIDDDGSSGRDRTLTLDFPGAGELTVATRDDDLLLRSGSDGWHIVLHQTLAPACEWRRTLRLRFDGGPILAVAALVAEGTHRSGPFPLARSRHAQTQQGNSSW
ncbi:TcdA/TcdB pore-forming domain-containing protein [Paludibacterium yongneupense]|uniref:TcdA/TcdB pore-forming domain-containing protein n=1 Tax=Paludibacterium yongneupense TaxID=400061 RepID=UPI000411E720|nr:TcdA/TcdB pore-forming domain-containing protein [Paludibacterium yongneupense]